MLGWGLVSSAGTGFRRYHALAACTILVLAFVTSLDAHADDVPQVHFAGFAYIGDDAAVASSYPQSRAVEEQRDGDVSVLDAALRDRAARVANPTFSIVFDELASLKPGQGSALVLAFALDRETVSVEQIGTHYKLLAELSAQALFVDFREMAVVASYPVVVQSVDVKQTAPTADDRRDAVRNLYLGSGNANVLEAFVQKLSSLRLNPNVERRVRVTASAVSEPARGAMSGSPLENATVFEMALAQDFSKFLSANQQIPVLPPSKGQAIGNRMATRFADGKVYNLEIPESDYAVELNLDELKRIEYGSSAAGRSFVYGAFLNVRVLEPLSGRVYFDARLRNGATKLVPASQANVDDAAAFQDALLALLDKFTASLTSPDPAWAEKHAGNKVIAKQMQELAKVLQSCR